MGAGSFWVENLCLLFRLWLPPWGQIKIASIELVDLLWLDNGRPKKSVNFQFKSFSRYLYSVERFEINLLNVVRGGVMACTQVPGIFHSVIAEFGVCFPRRKIRLDRRRESFFSHGASRVFLYNYYRIYFYQATLPSALSFALQRSL